MGCPTREEYEKALESKKYLIDLIRREKKTRERLIEQLCTSQGCLNNYEVLFINADEIIQKYEIYQEIMKDKK